MKEMDCVEVVVKKKNILQKACIRACKDGFAMSEILTIVGL